MPHRLRTSLLTISAFLLAVGLAAAQLVAQANPQVFTPLQDGGPHSGMVTLKLEDGKLAGGLQLGDIILMIDGKTFSNLKELLKINSGLKAGTQSTVVVLRGGQLVETSALSGHDRTSLFGYMVKERRLTAAEIPQSVQAAQASAPAHVAQSSGPPQAPASSAPSAAPASAAGQTQAVTVTGGGPASLVANVNALRDGQPHYGVLVDSVAPASPAQRGGMRQGDVILQVNGAGFSDFKNFMKLRDGLPKGVPAALLVLRGDHLTELKIGVEKDHMFGFLYKDRTVAASEIPAGAVRVTAEAAKVSGIPEIADFPQANEVQKRDIAAMRAARELYLHFTDAAWLPTEKQESGKNTAKVKCQKGQAKRIEYKGSMGVDYADHILMDVPPCEQFNANNLNALVLWGNRFYVGTVTLNGEYVEATRGGTGLYWNGEHYVLQDNVDGWKARAYLNPGGSYVLRTSERFFRAGREVPGGTAIAVMAPKGWGIGEVDAKEQFRFPDIITFQSMDGSISQSGKKVVLTDSQVGALRKTPMASFTRSLSATVEGTRLETKTVTPLGPPGTYYYGGTLTLGSIPLAKDVEPAPGTVARYAGDAGRCTYMPMQMEGWLPWTPGCTATQTALYSADGAFRLLMASDQTPAMTLDAFDPSQPGLAVRTWKAQMFTTTAPPLPVGEASLFNGDDLVYRGEFEGLEPKGKGTCPNPSGGTEPCTFANGQRVDPIYVARIAQEKLDAKFATDKQISADAAAARDQARQQTISDAREAERIRQEEIAAVAAQERREKAARRDAMWGSIMSGLQQVANDVGAQQQQQAAIQQQRNAAQQQSIAQQRASQQQTAANAAAQRAAQQQQRAAQAAAQAKTVAEKRAAVQQQQAAAIAAQKAAQAKLAAQKQSAAVVQMRPNTAPAGLAQNAEGAGSGNSASGGGSTGASGSDMVTVHYPEALVVCDTTQVTVDAGIAKPKFIRCIRSQEMGAHWENYNDTDHALFIGCDNGNVTHEYTAQGQMRIFGCGYGKDVTGQDPLSHTVDLVAMGIVRVPGRKVFTCELTRDKTRLGYPCK